MDKNRSFKDKNGSFGDINPFFTLINSTFMKKLALFCCIISTAFAGKGQNLVPNGDFEQYSGCPNFAGQMDSCLFWINPAPYPPAGSPDYFNQCASFVNVPN